MTKPKVSWGGARQGAGRPKSSPFVSHVSRPRIGKDRPAFITLKLRSAFEDLRNPEFFDVFEKATLRARRFGLRIIQFAIVPKKIMMWVEIKNQEQLEKSFKSLNTSLAVFLKKMHLSKTGSAHQGPVFLGRFEMQIIHTPEEARHFLREILLSPARHFSRSIYADDYSSGVLFRSWKEILDKNETFDEFDFSNEETARVKRITATPQFWLSQSGWRKPKAGRPEERTGLLSL